LKMGLDKQDKDIDVLIARHFMDIKFSIPKLKKLIKAIGVRFKLAEASVSIAIVDDDEITKVNKRFLDKDNTTDCISFDLSDDQHPADSNGNYPRVFDLIVNGQMAVRQSEQRGHSPEAELALYVTHGMLHNLGFDDATQSLSAKMHNTEDEILEQLGYGSVYHNH
jgi:probable rRNA maturation factor